MNKPMDRRIPLTMVMLGMFLWLPAAAFAGIPSIINVQGVIRDALGDPVDGTFNLLFTLYDEETEGTEWWSELQPDVPVDLGVFSVLLGSDPQNPMPAERFAQSGEVWLQAQLGSETPLPRQRLVSVPYALLAQRAVLADSAGGLDCLGCIRLSQLGFDPATQAELDTLAANPLAGIACSAGDGLSFDGAGWQCTPPPLGDISGVMTTIGSGLQGGAPSGDVALSIAAGGVSSMMIADATIVDADIAPGAAIDPSKIAGVIGDVTAVTIATGGGLVGGGTSGDLTLALLSCAAGSVLQSDGTAWTCSGRVDDSKRLGGLTESAFFRLDEDESIAGIPIFEGGISGVTPPFAVDSNTVVADLNADLLDGRNGNEYVLIAPLQVPRGNLLTAVDTGWGVGYDTSMTIGPDGLPVISYQDGAAYDLKVAKCGNLACSAGNTLTTVDAAGAVGYETSIAIGADGLPVIGYRDFTNRDLKVAKCGNASCSAGNTVTTVDSVGDVGHYAAIATGTDGRPVIAYQDATNLDLKVAACGNAACSTGSTLTTVDALGNTGTHPSVAVGTDGLPIIAYLSVAPNNLKVAKCGNASCSAGNAVTIVDATAATAGSTSIAIGADALPIIAYYDEASQDLKVAKCGNAACSSDNTLTIVDAAGSVGSSASLTIGPDGLPVISYLDFGNYDLKVAKCANPACSTGNTLTTVDASGNVGIFSSITIGTDGLPIVSYQDTTNTALKVVKCANPFCLPFWSRR